MTSDPPQEVELKLLVPPEDLPRLWRHARVRALTRGASTVQTLESIYFDTGDLDLARAGLVLRLRRTDRERVQTVKTRTAGSAGLFARGEWEAPIAGEVPDLSRIPDAALRARIAQTVAGKELAPILRTLVRRAQRTIGEADWEARFQLDVGESKSPRGSLPICELELELVRGDAAPLYDLAWALHRDVGLRPASVGKAERSLAALLGEPIAPHRARRPQLGAHETLDDVVAATLASCLDQIAANEEAVRDGRDPEGVHQMRVGARRLRSALALFREVIPEERRQHFRAELRWLGGELGDARDLDVFVRETLEPLLPHAPRTAAMGPLIEGARELKAEAHARARSALDSRRYAGLLLELGAWCAGRRWRDQPLTPDSARLFAPARDAGRPLLARRYRKLRRRGADVGNLTFEAAHQLRIELKKLRYACEFLRGVYPHAQRAETFYRRLGRLQDSLGHLNDQATADGLVERILARVAPEPDAGHARAAGFVSGWTSRVALEKLRPLEKQWKRLAKLEPFWKD